MKIPEISVVMSIYNESYDELHKSIDSILRQTFKDFEFIIINDNPKNDAIEKILSTISDERIRIYSNDTNLGLVDSLNIGIKLAKGKYIARMDADDISLETRIEDELAYLKCMDLDMVGSYIQLIDEYGNIIKSQMRFPTSNNKIKFFMQWGSCICHPTWLVKGEVYKTLGGYRKALHCEDYDFILRAIDKGYLLGNLPNVELQYRIRRQGISNTNTINQYLLRLYISSNRKRINKISESEILEYRNSNTFTKEKEKFQQYRECKINFKDKSFVGKVKTLCRIITNRYFAKDLVEKITLIVRENL